MTLATAVTGQCYERPRAIPALTGLRFVAAGLVLLSHSLITIVRFKVSPAWYTLLIATSAEGMTLFFVLSGFVIYYNYPASVSMMDVRSIYNFLVARFARLYPLYFFCLSFDLLMKWSFHELPHTTAQVLPYYLTLTQSWLYKPFGDHALIYQFGLMPQLSWSISTEWFFYLAFPLICLLLIRATKIRKVLTTAMLFAIGVILTMTATNIGMPALNKLGVASFGYHCRFRD